VAAVTADPPSPAVEAEPPAPVASAAATSSLIYASAAASAADPVNQLLLSLLEGQGELSQAELRRLELFRPERILEAASVLNESVAGRGKESRRSRLNKIRLHAETLRSAAEPDLPVEAALEEPAAAPSQEPEAWRPEPSLEEHLWGEPNGRHNTKVPPAEIVIGPEQILLPAPTDLDVPSDAVLPPDLEDPADADAPAAPDLVPDPDPVLDVQATADAHALEEYQAGTPVATPQEEEIEQEAWMSWPVAEAEVPVFETQVPDEPAQLGHVVMEQPSGDHLKSLDLVISSAEDVIGLPPHERGDALTFLDIPELERLVAQSDDPDLCRAVVDQLERLGTPASLRAISGILEEGEPGLQLYAVNAAERLLARL
jgi:hypothetical protein